MLAMVSTVMKASLCGVPDWTSTGSAQYIFPAFNGWDARLRADANCYGESTSFNNGTVVDRDSWSALNLRAGVLTGSRK